MVSIRLSFNPQKKNEPPRMIINTPATDQEKISNLYMFKNLEKIVPPKEDYLSRHKKIEEILQELDSLIGLASV